MSQNQTSRDGSGRIAEVTKESNEISGPLGIWPFPILNLIVSNRNNRMVVTEIRRDKNGRIQSIEEIKL